MRNRLDEEVYKAVAESNSMDIESVRTIVSSFFGAIVSEARALPFNNERKIYTKAKFDEYVSVTNIPYIGRLGPSYSRYLKWRANAAKETEHKSKEDYQTRLSSEEIEEMAKRILSGEKVDIRKKKLTDLYKRVWLVGKNGKRQARQVIPKTDK